MSRQSIAPRTLSLTEDLEKLEQSITLTLQGRLTSALSDRRLTHSEIDHNFSRAHRIVTSTILPVVEQYGRHSEGVWEASKVAQCCSSGSGTAMLTARVLEAVL